MIKPIRTDLSETLVSVVALITAALVEAWSIGGAEGVFWAVTGYRFTTFTNRTRFKRRLFLIF